MVKDKQELQSSEKLQGLDSGNSFVVRGQKIILTGECRGRGSKRQYQAITAGLSYIWVKLESLQCFFVQTDIEDGKKNI